MCYNCYTCAIIVTHVCAIIVTHVRFNCYTSVLYSCTYCQLNYGIVYNQHRHTWRTCCSTTRVRRHRAMASYHSLNDPWPQLCRCWCQWWWKAGLHYRWLRLHAPGHWCSYGYLPVVDLNICLLQHYCTWKTWSQHNLFVSLKLKLLRLYVECTREMSLKILDWMS